MRRAVIAGALVLSTVFASGTFLDRAGLGEGTAQAAPAAADTDVQISALRFGEAVDKDFNPVSEKVEFGKGTDFVWVVFEYNNYTGGKMTYLTRANGEDYSWGDINCCQFPSHRIGFKVDRKGQENASVSTTTVAEQPGMMSAFSVADAPALLPGAGYDVYIYLNGVEVGRGGFGVKGKKGLDSGSDNETNDNH